MQRRISHARMAVAGGLLVVLLALWSAALAGAVPVTVGRSGWFWGDPFPQGETLNQVAFAGARGYAAGANGTVLRSDDGGESWRGLISGTGANLTLLQEVDPETVLVGGGCTLRESTDGGAEFHRLAVDPSEQSCASQVAGISFLSPRSGYVELADGTVLETSDGGQTVQQRTAVPLAGATAEQIYFRSASVGFALVSGASGGRIYRTTDGAGSWTQVGASTNNEPLYDIYFQGPTNAYAVGGGDPFTVDPVSNGTVLLTSEDEGEKWEERKSGEYPPQEIHLPEGTGVLALHQIACSEPLQCLITTGTKTLVRTADGGETGAPVTPSEAPLSSIAFTTGLNLIGVGEAGTTVLSPDGGATFPAQISHRLGVELDPAIRLGSTPQSAYVAGDAGVIAETSDGGAEWGLIHAPTTADLIDVAFPSPQVGYAVDSSGTLYRTANGGQSWAIESGGEAPSRLIAPNASTVIRVGPTGLTRSTDSGATFAAVPGTVVLGRRHGRVLRRRLSAFPLFAGAQIAGSAVIAWGDEAIESLDGGASWKLIPKPLASGEVEAISFVTPTNGYEVSRQRLFFTRNAGRSWSEISALGTGALGGEGMLSFSSVDDGYALSAFAGRENVLLRTTDGGRSWTPEVLPRHLVSVLAGGASDYAAGIGSLFATADGGLSPEGSTLTLRLAGPTRVSRALLHRSHDVVKVSGTLSPAAGGETVRIAWRAVGGSVWHSFTTVASSGGSFSMRLGNISSSTDFVAQWTGEGALAGAGSRAVRLTVTRR